MDTDMDFSQLLSDIGCTDIFDQDYMTQDIDFTSLFNDISETKSTALSCVECVYEPTPVSNIEMMPASSDCEVEKKPASSDCNIEMKPSSSDCNDEKNILHVCSTCAKKFSRKFDLKRHMRIHERKENNTVMMIHSKGKLTEKTRVYNCSTCKKICSSNSKLKRHMKIHTREKLFSCEVCLKLCSTKNSLKRHMLLHNINEKEKPSFRCQFCNSIFFRKDQFNQHVRQYQNSTYVCTDCNQKFCKRNNLKAHTRKCHIDTPKVIQISTRNPYFENVKCFKRKNELNECSTTTFESYEDYNFDVQGFLWGLSSSVENEMKYQLFEKKYFKCNFMLEAIITPSSNDEENEFCTLYLNSNIIVIYSEDMINKCVEQVFTEMLKQYSYTRMDWRLTKIIKLDVLCIKFNSL